MNWIAIGKPGDPYPAAVRKLEGKSGVYAIRHRGLIFTTVVYVGESHTGNLRKTLTRHFQSWSRGKKWWVGQYAPQQTDPGHTYDRASSEIAFEVCSKAEAVALQAKWIDKLSPRDNLAGVDDVPF